MQWLLAVVFLAATVGIFAADRAAAQTVYYVDQGHGAASDSASGAEDTPFRTIGRAVKALQPGDTVVVKSGSYPERITFPAGVGGEPGRKITFRAEPRRSVTMWGFSTANAAHLRIEGFSITIPDTLTGWDQVFGVFVRSDSVEVVDNYFFDIRSAAIQGDWGRPWRRNVYVAGNRIYRAQRGIMAYGDNWLIEDNEVERLIQHTASDTDYSRFFGNGIVFRNNRFHGTQLAEIGTGHADCWQTFNHNGEYATNILIEGNVCQDAHQGMMLEIVAGSTPSVGDLTVRNNVFNRLWSWGIATKNEIRGLRVFHNVFANIRYHGLGCRGSSQCEIRNNIFYNAGSSYWADATADMQAGKNLVYRTDRLVDPTTFPNDLVNVDPLFVDAARGDFHLQAGSPAVDAGTALTGVTLDFDRVPRPQGLGWDIGAYEVGSALAAPTNLRVR